MNKVVTLLALTAFITGCHPILSTSPTDPGQPVKVQLQYAPGSLVPAISIRASCGNRDIDQQVMQGFADYRFPGDPIMPPGQKTYEAIAVVRTDGMSERERIRQAYKKD